MKNPPLAASNLSTCLSQALPLDSPLGHVLSPSLLDHPHAHVHAACAYMPDPEHHLLSAWCLWCALGDIAAFALLSASVLQPMLERLTLHCIHPAFLTCAGCDAFSVHLILAAVACSLNLGPSWKAVAGSMIIMTPWALAHWEEYHCGTMLYGNGYWGLTEANYALVVLHLITAWVRSAAVHRARAVCRSSEPASGQQQDQCDVGTYRKLSVAAGFTAMSTA